MILCHDKMLLYIILPMVLKGTCEYAYPKSSLVFVIDKTLSMGDVIEAVKNSTDAIFTTVTKSSDSPIENFVLVMFGHPNVSEALVTTDKEEFRKTLNEGADSLENGGDCPELCMTGIKKAIEASLRGSYIYVFTDAAANDTDKFTEVKRLAQEKECQVVFVLLGMCEFENPSNLKFYSVYPELAEATGGQIFHLKLPIEDTEKILKYVNFTIMSRTVIVRAQHYTKGYHELPIDSDTKTKGVIISISATNRQEDPDIQVSVEGPDGELVSKDAIVEMNEIKILAINNFMPGSLVAFKCEAPTYVVVTVQSDVRFRHGFTKTIVSSLNNTSFNPIPATKHYLFIQLFGDDVELSTVNLVTEYYSDLFSLTLELKDKTHKLYATELFDPPTSKFRISVIGTETISHTKIVRYGSLVQTETSIEDETSSGISKRPKVNIEGANKRTIKYNENLELNCSVDVYPTPKVFAWRDSDGKEITSKIFERKPPLNSYRILELKNLKKTGTYECYAENGSYKDSVTIKVEVTSEKKARTPPTSKPKKKLKLEKPTNLTIIVDPGENVTLTCRVKEGHPKPKLTWHFKSTLRPYELKNFTNLKHYNDHENITLPSVNKYQTGVYKCTAYNSETWDILEFSVGIRSQLTVALNTTEEIIVKRGETVNVKCTVQGVPTPKASWIKNGKEIVETDNITVFRNLHMRFKAEEHHTANYTCQAENEYGSDNKSVPVTVHYMNIKSPDNTHFEPKVGEKVYLPCGEYISGMPKFTFQWKFTRFNEHSSELVSEKVESKESGAISIKNGNLELTNLKAGQRGNYTCEASNKGNSESIRFSVDVLFPPEIGMGQITSYQAVQGDCVLKIFCNVTGNPKPLIVWGQKGLKLANIDNLVFEEGYLNIRNVSIKDDGLYDCDGSSTKFMNKPISLKINVTVSEYPDSDLISNTPDTIITEIGKKVPIKCQATHGNFDKITWFKDGKLIGTGNLELASAKISDSGSYTCRVSSCTGETEPSHANTTLIVGFKPQFNTSKANVVELELYVGESISLDCSASGIPKPKGTWYRNGIKKEDFTGLVYHDNMTKDFNVNYSCRIENINGHIIRIFKLKLKDCILRIDEYTERQPLLLTNMGTWPSYRTINGNTTIPIFEEIKFSCPTLFEKIGPREVPALCYGGTKFFFREKVHDFADIKCKEAIRPETDSKRKQCQGKGTSILKIGFKHNKYTEAIEAIEYCLDRNSNPKYAKYVMKSPAGYIPKNTDMWDGTDLSSYNCDTQRKKSRSFAYDFTKCCFAKRYLVNPRDVFPGQLQRATFNRLNIVLHWSTCNSENWEELERRIRNYVINTTTELIIYTGTTGELVFDDIFGGRKPLMLRNRLTVDKFLWKVVQNPVTKSSIAIIQVNKPGVRYKDMDDYIQCTDICRQISWLRGHDWNNVEKGYIYCCPLKHFKRSFDKIENIRFEPYDDVLY